MSKKNTIPNKKLVLLSGMRPTGALHLGHWIGVLKRWVAYQEDHECYFMIADWHALMSEYKNPTLIESSILNNLAMWIAMGLDPNKSVLFLQSDVPEHLELYSIFSTITPLSWLERCPTYKDQLTELKDKEIKTHAFLGYPLLQTADIALYSASVVPVGADQLPHIELAREVIRRFHRIYNCRIFPEPQGLLGKTSNKIAGIDGRKMSKSYGNHIALNNDSTEISQKIQKMLTDTGRVRLKDSGNPDRCPVFDLQKIFNKESESDIRDWCVGAKKGCRDCKLFLSDSINRELDPIRNRYLTLIKEPHELKQILKKGAEKARSKATITLNRVREIFSMNKSHFSS